MATHTVVGVSSLNNTALSIGSQAPVEGSTGASMRPGPATSGFVIIPPNTGGGGIGAIITSITNPGTSGAYCIAKELDASGYLGVRTYSPVYIIPYPQFAEIGDRGIMATFTPTSGTGGADVRYIHISRSTFLKY